MLIRAQRCPFPNPQCHPSNKGNAPGAPGCASAAVAVRGWRDHHLHLPPVLCSHHGSPTSLIRAPHSQTRLLTLIPSSSRPLRGKVIQLSPGSQRGLKTRKEERRSAQQQEKPALLRTISFYGFLRPAAGESLSRFCAVSPVNK